MFADQPIPSQIRRLLQKSFLQIISLSTSEININCINSSLFKEYTYIHAYIYIYINSYIVCHHLALCCMIPALLLSLLYFVRFVEDLGMPGRQRWLLVKAVLAAWIVFGPRIFGA